MLKTANRLLPLIEQLGMRRLAALALVGTFVAGAIFLGAMFLGKPAMEVVYAGLEANDVSRIGAALQEAGVSFDANAENTAVYVPAGQAARARMILAEKGLPQSDRAGYELFDNLGSMGLTSFMQQVTRVRALEGELARSIQLMNGVKAARVHIVLPKESAFGSAKGSPTASVMIRTDASFDLAATRSLKHLVAAAVPGLVAGEVTVLSTDGSLLSAGEDPQSAGASQMVELERAMAQELQEKIAKTLAPFLGAENFRASVTAKLNMDRSQVNETVFDPESRVERSVRTTKESNQAQNASSDQPVSVQQNIPQEAAPASSPESSSEKRDKREELTNYEISSKSTSTTSDGYKVEHISVALIVNKSRLTAALGEKPEDGAAEKLLKEIETLTATAAGTVTERGDTIKVTAAEFLEAASTMAPVPDEPISDVLLKHLGTFVNAAAMIAVAGLVLFAGLKPALKAILGPQGGNESLPALAEPVAALPNNPKTALGPSQATDMLGELADHVLDIPQKRKLAQIVEFDSERAARILKEWLNEPERA